MFPDIKEELEHALDTEFPTFADWTPFRIHPKLMRLICRVSARAFVGHTFQRSESWIRLNCAYTLDAFTSASLIRAYPSLLRPIIKYFIPSIRRMWAHNAQAISLLTPIVRARNAADEKEDDDGKGYEKPNDTIEWIRDSLKGNDKHDYEYQAIIQLAIGAASIHTTSGIVTAALYNLATYPEYIPILRDEAATVLAAHNGIWTLESMSQLSKFDSFMKETQRHDPAGLIAFQRKTLKAITLSDGTVIPANTQTFSATEAISSSPSTYDSPTTFSGGRYRNARMQSETAACRDQFVSTSPTQLHFGAGRHACPGRCFASHEIKMILINFLERYDLKLKDGEERPKNFKWQIINSPDPMGEIMMKSRRGL